VSTTLVAIGGMRSIAPSSLIRNETQLRDVSPPAIRYVMIGGVDR